MDQATLPKYLEIQRDVERQILTGAWPPGHRVPPEAELMVQYACSRMTVNKAISALAASGAVVRRRRLGSFVSPPRRQVPLLSIQDIPIEIAASGRVHRYRILRRHVRVADLAQDAAEIGVETGTPILALDVLHLADDERFALELRQINLHLVPEATNEPFRSVPPGTWLLQNVPWTEAEHAVSAVAADLTTSRRLKLPAGEPCLEIARRTWNDGRLVTAVRMLYPADRYRLVGRFTPGA